MIKEREGSSEFPFTYNTDNPFRLELTKGRGRFIVEEIEVFDIKQIIYIYYYKLCRGG